MLFSVLSHLTGRKVVGEAVETGVIITAFEALKGAGRALLGKFANKAGEKIPAAVDNWVASTFGLDSEDERKYNQAKSRMKPNDRVMLGKKMATLQVKKDPVLTRKRYNWFRVTCLHADITEMVRIMTGYALLSDAAWERECVEMDYKRVESEHIAIKWLKDRWKTIWPFVKEWHSKINAAFAAHPIKTDIKSWAQRAVEKNAETPWS